MQKFGMVKNLQYYAMHYDKVYIIYSYFIDHLMIPVILFYFKTMFFLICDLFCIILYL